MLGDPHIANAFMVSMIAAVISTVGLLSMAALGDWGRRNSPYFSSFAIGVLLVAVIFHIVPQALDLSAGSWRWMAAGFIVMGLIGCILWVLPRQEASRASLAFGYASVIALGVHSFFDGAVYVASFHDDNFTGWLTTLGLFFHEFPEGVIAFFLLREAGQNALGATWWAFVTASLTTIAGTLASAYFIGFATQTPLSAMLGVTAGGLFYIILFHLTPHAAATPKGRAYLTASIGVVIALLAIILRHA